MVARWWTGAVAFSCFAGALHAQQRTGDPASVSAQTTDAGSVHPPSAVVVRPDATDAITLDAAMASLGTTVRVLMIGAHPDDEDTQLLTWLARGRHAETAYLSLTRGDGGQNLIGDELGAGLGAIRTEELLAARRIDGGRQYFTRAFDFGFSKSATETLRAWPADSILADVVRVVRAFRPHIIVSVFSGTPRDGHGHHQVAGRFARAAYDRSMDTVAFPTATHGAPWTVAKFYRNNRFSPADATLRINLGEYSPRYGMGFAELAADSRSQHKSQGFGALRPRGTVWGYVKREATRADSVPATTEQSLFDGVGASLEAMLGGVPRQAVPAVREAVDALNAARASHGRGEPRVRTAALARVVQALRAGLAAVGDTPNQQALRDALFLTEQRATRALVLSAGVWIDAESPRATLPVHVVAKRDVADTMPLRVQVYNRGSDALTLHAVHTALKADANPLDSSLAAPVVIAPDSSWRGTLLFRHARVSAPWWMAQGRGEGYFRQPIDTLDEHTRWIASAPHVDVTVVIAGVPVTVRTPVVHRTADPVEGEVITPLAALPGISITVDRTHTYARAGAPFARELRVTVRSAYPTTETVAIALALPEGVRTDSAERIVTVRPNEPMTVTVPIAGTLRAGRHAVRVRVTHRGVADSTGFIDIRYAHIRTQRPVRDATVQITAVETAAPFAERIAYVKGVSDDGIGALQALGYAVDEVAPDALTRELLARYAVLVIGPRAYQVHRPLTVANRAIFAFAESGGTVVVQYGQFEMQDAGMMPFPVTFTRPAARVTDERANVVVRDAAHPVLTTPNRITPADWEGWVQERALYMPSTAAAEYARPLAMQDPEEPLNDAAILVAPVGRGVYAYTSLALFRQLPDGVPGAARVLANLIALRGSAGTR